MMINGLKNPQRLFPILAALSGATCVMLGAFAAHALKSQLTPKMLEVMETGIKCQFYHTLALLVVTLFLRQAASRLLTTSGLLFIAGMLCFSGSLYVYVLASVPWVVYITPVGGSLLIFGWLALAVHFMCEKRGV